MNRTACFALAVLFCASFAYAQTKASGTVTIAGTAQTKPAAAAVSTITISGHNCNPACYSGSVSIVVDVNYNAATPYNSGNIDPGQIATALAGQINSPFTGFPVSAVAHLPTASDPYTATIDLTAKTTGAAGNYSLSTAVTGAAFQACLPGGPGCVRSGAMTGGRGPVADSGTITIQVNGSPVTAPYDSSSTPTSLAAALVANVGGSYPATATSSGGVVTLTANVAGTVGNTYSLAASVTSNDPANFPTPSFSATTSGATLAGGTDAPPVPSDLCISPVGGLAGLPTIDGVVSGDAGWNNAAQLNLSGDLGATTATRMWLGSAGSFVYLGLRVSAPVADPNTTVVLVISPDGNPANDWRFHIQPFNAAPPTNAPIPQAVTWWRNSSTWNSTAGTTANAGDWQKDNIKFTSPTSNLWELEFKIPVAATAAANSGICFNCGTGGLFKIYVNVLTTTSGVPGVPPTVAQDVWPPCQPGVLCGSMITSGVLEQRTPSPVNWGTGSGTARPACTGVSLTWDKVGVQDPANAANIVGTIRRFANVTETTIAQCEALADSANPASNGPDNIFVAKPQNNMSTPAHVNVTFRVANWGIPGAQFSYLGSPLCDTANPPNCVGVTANPTANGTIAAGASGDFSSTHWALNYKQSCYYTMAAHQCIQVEMDSNDPNTRLLNRSVQRNMDFVSASKFQREAHISGDQGPLASRQSEHRFLLLVENEQEGMVYPAHVREGGKARGRMFKMRDRQLAAMARRHFGKKVSNLNAWIVRGYVYTGKKIVIHGQEFEVVRRAGDFGYVAGHAGAIAGWDVQFTGDGLRTVAPNLYFLRVPPGQEVRLKTQLSTRR